MLVRHNRQGLIAMLKPGWHHRRLLLLAVQFLPLHPLAVLLEDKEDKPEGEH